MHKVHFILFVADQDAATAFFAEVLAARPTLVAPGMTQFALPGGAVLGLMPERGVQRLLGEALPAGGPRAELYLLVDEPGEYYARALRAGARSLSALAPRDWGHEVAYCLTSDAHVLAFARPTP